MTDFYIDSEAGRIGQFWWFNSDQQPVTKFVPLIFGLVDMGMVVKRRLVRWGSCGFGRNVRIYMEPIDD
jgi:hypothetical protein